MDELLEFHLSESERYNDRLLRCKSYEPDFINLILAERRAFLFHRQLILNRSEGRFAECAAAVDEMTSEAAFKLWTEKHDLAHLGLMAQELFNSLAESWWTRLTPKSFTYEKLKALDDEITESLLRVLSSNSAA